MIAKFLHNNPRLLVLLLAVITVTGLSSATLLPRLEDPILRKRVALISTIYPGAHPQQIESVVTAPLERHLAGISEIKEVRSTSRTSISNIVVHLNDDVVDVDPVWSLVRERMIDAGADLPQSCEKPMLEVLPLKAFASLISLTSVTDGQKANPIILRRLAAKLRSRILTIPGTEQVRSFGDPGEELVVNVDPLTLASTGLSTAAIAQQVASGHSDQAGGSLRSGDSAWLLDLKGGELPTQEIADVLISPPSRQQAFRLGEIARIERREVIPRTEQAMVGDRSAIVLGVMVNDEMRVDRWSEVLVGELRDFESRYANEISVELLFSQRDHIERRMSNLLQNLVLSTAAVVLVVFLLMGWRSMVVVATALPLSALMVLSGMRLLSIPIHQMSVTGLIVALGLLIDNAIVIVEDVRSRIHRGESATTAIVASVTHLAMPLFGSTLTTALAFLPIATLPGPAGEFVGTIAISVILAICASYVLAMTIIPAMIGVLRLRPGRRGIVNYGLRIQWLEDAYANSLKFVFRYPVVGVLLGLLLPSLGFFVAQRLPQQFFPPSDRRQIQIEIERPARDTIQGVQKTVAQVRQIIADDPRLRDQNWFLGGSAPTFYYNVVPWRRGTPFYAQAFIRVRSGFSITQLVRDLQSAIDEQVFDSRVIVRQLEQGPPFDAPIEVRLLGPDLAVLQDLGSQVRAVLAKSAGVIHTRSDLEDTIPKLVLSVDRMAVQKAGLSEVELAQFLYTTAEGAPAGTVFDGGEELPIRVRVDFGGASKREILAALRVPSRRVAMGQQSPLMAPHVGRDRGTMSPTLASLASFELDSDVGAISRIDGRRVNEIKAYLVAGRLPSVTMQEFKRRLSESDFSLPSGYALELGGEAEQRTHAVSNLVANAIVLFSVILLTLVAVFRSFRSAFIVAVVGGLSAGMGPFALYVFGFPFGFMAIVGTMGLVGVAINDSIVVLAAIRANETSAPQDPNGMASIVTGCTRHVVATTLTTIAGFLPLVLFGGDFWPPLAITIAGGVGGATLLALYFVPSLNLLLHRHRAPESTIPE